MNTATASPSQPGMSREDAIRIARQTISQPATFLSAEAGRYADVAADGREGPGFPVEPGHLVWAVKFAVIVADICPPNGLPCFSPRPGTATIVLDKVTGVLLVSGVVAPAP